MGARLVKFDQNLFAIGSAGQEKIDESLVSARMGFRIYRNHCKLISQNCRGAIYIAAAKLHLLYTLAKLGEELCNGA